MEQHPPRPTPVFEILIDQEGCVWIGLDIFDAAQLTGADRLGLGVDCLIDRVAQQNEAHRNHRGPRPVRGCQMPDPRPGDAPPQTRIDQKPRLSMTVFLREADVKSLLTMDATLAALEAAFREWAAGRASNQPRRRVTGTTAVLATMSAALPSSGLMGFKAYTHDATGAHFWVALFDAADGRPRALIEADWL